jgi:hypothetical protein
MAELDNALHFFRNGYSLLIFGLEVKYRLFDELIGSRRHYN